ncbi:MAG: RNA methyltransferase [Acidobacteriota bacterium]|nr:RNA methyltransferase [Acidobacteriota bacterium]
MAEGPKLLDEALRAGAMVEAVLVAASHAAPLRDRLERASQRGARIIVVADGVLERASDTVSPQPVAAIVETIHVPLEVVDLTGLAVVCAGVQDPGNAGTVIRSAAATGVGAVVFCANGVDVYNPKVVRASAGSLFHVPVVCAGTATEVLGHLGARGVRRVASAARGGRDHDRMDWSGPSALVLGSESQGLAADLDGLLDERVTIPMAPDVESLNVAMAATVICFEADRQRRQVGGARP